MTLRVVIARVISIVAHPVVLMFFAALVAADARGAPPARLGPLAAVMAALAAIVVGFTWWQVRAGRWTHVDASARSERPALNFFLIGLLLVCAAAARLLPGAGPFAAALAAAAALIAAGLLLGRWVKMSLHASFAAFATVLVWPVVPAVCAGIVVTAAVAWSRRVLGRHVVADLVAGLLLGAAAGAGYHLWAS